MAALTAFFEARRGRLYGFRFRDFDFRSCAGLEPPRQRGPRLAGLQVQGTAEGARLPCVFGRARGDWADDLGGALPGEAADRPGVERRDKPTEPLAWPAAGLDRGSAHLISDSDGGSAYGGTPSDESVRHAVAELKGQQETAVAATPAGAVVVMLDGAITRAEAARNERGLPLVWRDGPRDAPAGGSAAIDTVWIYRGLAERPWSPAHARALTWPDGGFDLGWLPRHRLGGDGWDGEPAAADPLRFRVRVLDGETEVRALEVEGTTAIYGAAEAGADFPDGTADLGFAVSQWGDGWGWGWGVETRFAPGRG
jgi:hypothetical protein